ncbi:5-formyltetrahydrofolate cyclo-ligase [Granulibacter bethesdensis]|nr:5-formyltetrahydrofolate cyclo-ligase [Granulibacter bethesdensis]
MPTCSSRSEEDDTPTARVAPLFPFSHYDAVVMMLADQDMSLAGRKQALRQRAYALRESLDPSAGIALGENLLRDLPPTPGHIVSAFWPLPGELDLRPLMAALYAGGHRIALPVTTKKGEKLIFREWTPGVAMIEGRFRTLHPDGPEIVPETVLVPLLAFDRTGNRLGYGGGYYDRTLAALPSVHAIGCAFAAFELEDVPVEATDFPLRAIVTERETILCPDRQPD